MRVLFLDCDGVMAPFSSAIRSRAQALDGRLMRRVARFVERHDLTVVLASTWRHEVGFGATVTLLARHWPDATARIRWQTPILQAATRGEEIAAWLDDHPVEAFVILDDADAMAPVEAQHVAIEPRVGVTTADLRRAAAILRKSADVSVYADNNV
jgi:hypothetical protein